MHGLGEGVRFGDDRGRDYRGGERLLELLEGRVIASWGDWGRGSWGEGS